MQQNFLRLPPYHHCYEFGGLTDPLLAFINLCVTTKSY